MKPLFFNYLLRFKKNNFMLFNNAFYLFILKFKAHKLFNIRLTVYKPTLLKANKYIEQVPLYSACFL